MILFQYKLNGPIFTPSPKGPAFFFFHFSFLLLKILDSADFFCRLSYFFLFISPKFVRFSVTFSLCALFDLYQLLSVLLYLSIFSQRNFLQHFLFLNLALLFFLQPQLLIVNHKRILSPVIPDRKIHIFRSIDP